MASKSIIGIDEHIGDSNYFGVNSRSGEILGVGEFKTKTDNLIKAVTQFPEPRIVIIEQGPLSEWTERVLEKYVEEVVIADTKRNSWIAKDPQKSDRIDGEKLVRLYMGGYIKRIVSRSKEKQELISLTIHYYSLVKESTRLKNQIGAKFRQGGKRKRGSHAYREESIREDIRYLWHNKGLQTCVRNYHSQLKVVKKHIEDVTRRLQKLSCNYPEIAFLDKFPGIGFIGSVTLSGLIDVPERFSTVKELWIYCGYGLDQQSSGGWAKRHRITKRGNRYLKGVIGTATHNIITLCKGDTCYKKYYLKGIEQGKDPGKLKANLARKLIKDIWLGWIEFKRQRLRKAA
jgi:transposase